MTRAQLIRKECLLQLYAVTNKEFGITATAIRKQCRHEALDYSETEIRDALYFLKGQGFVETTRDETSGEARHRITSKGIMEFEDNYAA